MGTIDKVIRILVAVVIVVLYFTHVISGVLAIILLALSAIFVVTSLLSFCPLYLPFDLSTRKKGIKKKAGTNRLIFTHYELGCGCKHDHSDDVFLDGDNYVLDLCQREAVWRILKLVSLKGNFVLCLFI